MDAQHDQFAPSPAPAGPATGGGPAPASPARQEGRGIAQHRL